MVYLRTINGFWFGVDNVANSLTAGAGYQTDYAVECMRNNLPMACNTAVASDTYKLYDPAVDKTFGTNSGGVFSPSHVKVINFGYNPEDVGSADGSLSFSQLGNPEIEVKFGAGANGSNGNGGIAGNGGVGLSNSLRTGSGVFYAGGGGGGIESSNQHGTGGNGGGGDGGDYDEAPVAGTANTGGGGGASGDYDNPNPAYAGAAGGSGIVVIRYET